MPALRTIEVDFHPSLIAELLAHASALCRDSDHIAQHSQDWLREASNFHDGTPDERERFATTLGTAFSLLGENPIEVPYETYLQANPGFSAAPWKAWFSGTRSESGFGLLRERIGRLDIETSSIACLGGICGVLPDDASPLEEQAWARDWLERLEAAKSMRRRQLLPVSAEVCLAHARLGMATALN